MFDFDSLRRLFASQRLAVLATHKNGQPWGSLVAFAATDDLKTIVFATSRTTRKYANLRNDARVSLLVDNRSNEARDFDTGTAVTVTGTAQETADDTRQELESVYLAKHPYLREFVSSPNAALMVLKVERYNVVTQFQNVVEVTP